MIDINNKVLSQQEMEKRVRNITKLIEVGRMHAIQRMHMHGPEIGIMVKDGIIVWGALPETAEEDEKFVAGLLDRARAEASRP